MNFGGGQEAKMGILDHAKPRDPLPCVFRSIQQIPPSWLLLGLALFLAAVTGGFQSRSANTDSRLATVQSLVERGTLAIDQSKEFGWTIDKVYVNGRFYSDKPPVLSLIGSAIYLPLEAAGFGLAWEKNIAYFLIVFLSVGASFLLCIVCFYDALRFTPLASQYRILVTASLALATLFFPWSTAFTSHGFAAAWVFIGFYLLLRARETSRIRLVLSLAGLALSLAAAADLACLVYVVAFGAFIAWNHRLRGGLIHYAAFSALMTAPAVLIPYYLSGDYRPFQMRIELYHYPGSPWNAGVEELTGTMHGLAFAARYAIRCLFGPQGFLLYNPLLLIALWGSWRTFFRRGTLWTEAGISLTASSLVAGYYFLFSSNYGGWSYSIRWLVVTIPLLWFFSYSYFEKMTKAKWRLFTCLAAVSLCASMVGACNPFPAMLKPRAGFVVNVLNILRHLGL